MQDRDHWPLHARQWHRLGPPLRPSPEDLAIVAGAARALASERPGAPLSALILGVTPELATLAWPEGTALTAVDRSQGMIDWVWPSAGLPAGAAARSGDWRRLPISTGARDLVAGDGCHCLLGYPGEQRALGAEVHRALRPGGLFVTRVFIRPDAPEDVAALRADLRAGKIGNFHVLKWRLAMALQPSTEEGVRVSRVWEAFQTLSGEPALSRFPAEAVATIDAYRDASARYTFPALGEVRAALAEHFVERALHLPGYELGERCPTLVLERPPDRR